ITRGLGGNRFAQALACICVLITPVYLSIFNFYSMNSFDILFWALLFYVLVQLIKSGNENLWVPFGFLAGLGMENKYSVVFLLFGMFVGLILTPHRKKLLSKPLAIGVTIAVFMMIPHLAWEYQNHWPTLEFMRNATEMKNARVSPVEF